MEIPIYQEDDYPQRFLQGVTVFPDDTRIFHRVGYAYDHAVRIGSVRQKRGIFTAELVLASGEKAAFSVEAVAQQVLRLRFWEGQSAFDDASPMLLPLPAERPTLEVSEQAQAWELGLGGYRLLVAKNPFSLLLLSPHGERIFESETETIVGMLTAPPLGLRRKMGEEWAFLSWRSRSQDRYYGLGEKFTRFEKTSTRATIWQADTCGSNTTDMSYKAVPALFSTAGWGLLLHTAYRSYWEVGSFSYATGSAMVEDDQLDAYLMLAPTLKELTQLYTGLTGRPALPPKWALGVWMSRAAYRDREQMTAVADRLRAEGIPCDVFSIDPTWMKKGYYNLIGVETCDFSWNEAAWQDAESLFAEFAEKGFGICLWINPYLPKDSPLYAEALEKGYLVRTLEGGTARLEFDLAVGIVDFTHPAAKAWWQEKLAELLRKGVATFKVDFGDRVPEDALFANGKNGREMHNLYVHLYAEAVFEVVKAARGQGIIWRRPGYIGSQRFPGSWAGDTQVTWEGMRGALRGGLSAAFTGEAFWGHDIGGFVGPKPSDELYIRWAQFGLLSPLARFHGTTPREPWEFGPLALDVVRKYARLRYALLPTLLAAAHEATVTGLPILRPLVMEFQGEPGVDQIDDAYMLGEDLLVAPVFEEGARQRWVYFPAGVWRQLEAPKTLVYGPGYRRVDARLAYIPVYVREGAVLLRYAEPPQNLKGPAPAVWMLDLYPGESARKLEIPEEGGMVTVDYHYEKGAARLQVSPAVLHVILRLVDCESGCIRVENTSLDWEFGGGYAIAHLDASQGIDLRFQDITPSLED
jgi:alpha-D-xyloside xylohydrolase